MHGHSYCITVHVQGECDERLGWLIDYADISAAFDPLFDQLDHRCLNEVDGLADVSTEGLSDWIAQRLQPAIPLLNAVETEIIGDCTYAPETGSESVAFTFEAAHYLPNLPETHKCRRLHGHSFRVHVEAASAIDMESIRTVYEALDHRDLNGIEELQNPTSEIISAWIWDRLSETNALAAVTVAETCTASCTYRGP